MPQTVGESFSERFLGVEFIVIGKRAEIVPILQTHLSHKAGFSDDGICFAPIDIVFYVPV